MTRLPRILALDAAAAQPWRNGAGVTRELLAWPSAAAWQVRVSVADIDRDGAFSAFPGVARWLCVLEGEGVALQIYAGASVEHCLRRGDPPLTFDGAASVHCRLLAGATRDLNLMLQGCGGGLLRAAADTPWQPPGARCGLFTGDGGRLRGDDLPAAALPPRSLAWFDVAPQRLVFEPGTPSVAALEGDPGDASASPAAWWLWADAAGVEDS